MFFNLGKMNFNPVTLCNKGSLIKSLSSGWLSNAAQVGQNYAMPMYRINACITH